MNKDYSLDFRCNVNPHSMPVCLFVNYMPKPEFFNLGYSLSQVIVTPTYTHTHTCLCVFFVACVLLLQLYVAKDELYLCKVGILILLSYFLQAKFTVINEGPDSNIIECEGIGLKNSA